MLNLYENRGFCCQIFLKMSVEKYLKMSVGNKYITNKEKLYLRKNYTNRILSQGSR